MTNAALVRRVARLEAARRIGTADVVRCPRCGGSGSVAWPVEQVLMADVHARLGQEPVSTPSEQRGCRLCSARGEVPVGLASQFSADVEAARAWIERRLSEVASRLGAVVAVPIGGRREDFSERGPDAS